MHFGHGSWHFFGSKRLHQSGRAMVEPWPIHRNRWWLPFWKMGGDFSWRTVNVITRWYSYHYIIISRHETHRSIVINYHWISMNYTNSGMNTMNSGLNPWSDYECPLFLESTGAPPWWKPIIWPLVAVAVDPESWERRGALSSRSLESWFMLGKWSPNSLIYLISG